MSGWCDRAPGGAESGLITGTGSGLGRNTLGWPSHMAIGWPARMRPWDRRSAGLQRSGFSSAQGLSNTQVIYTALADLQCRRSRDVHAGPGPHHPAGCGRRRFNAHF
jgi:hypothetical protein